MSRILVNKIVYEHAGSWNDKLSAQKQAKAIRKNGGRAVVKKTTKQGKITYKVYTR